ncbi:HAMP domain-containing protein [Alginatibacterium sediminis]|uniref:histidine kinase n=1 Tax=Alginatibacterium sediminis TaxID=2164068 RepID=A0A420E689_9ALTE|nr:ATP-binding protein [Alginatibacterium sediminis]RKF13131.1 HAMP domain-containing protein [Alginatibacterium sediminis]
MVLKKLPAFNGLFVKIFLAFWAILLITSWLTISIARHASVDNFVAPSWATQRANSALSMIQLNPEFIDAKFPNMFAQKYGRAHIVSLEGEFLNKRGVRRNTRRFIANHSDPMDPRVALIDNNIVIGPYQVSVRSSPSLFYLEKRATDEQLQAFTKLSPPLWALVGVAILFSFVLIYLLTNHFVKPLRQLQSAANRISMGKLQTRLPQLKRGDEIGQLGESLERMLSALNSAISNQQRLLSDISHELRSPLTRLNMAVALHRKRSESTPEIARIERESARLEEMIAALLSLSRSQINAEQSSLELPDLLQDIIEDCEFEASQLQKQFVHSSCPQVIVHCYPNLLASAVENICRNALKYASHKVELEITTDNQQLNIIVKDDGPGLPEAELVDIFRPFYRSGEARDRDSGGVGLGLAIAESAVVQHSGQISARNRTQKGLALTITIPLQ